MAVWNMVSVCVLCVLIIVRLSYAGSPSVDDTCPCQAEDCNPDQEDKGKCGVNLETNGNFCCPHMSFTNCRCKTETCSQNGMHRMGTCILSAKIGRRCCQKP